MTDLHSHVLPGVDDGAKDEAMSLAMMRAAVADGITHLAATPHHQNGRYRNERLDVLEKVAALNELAAQNQLDLTVVPGQEVRLYGELLEDFSHDKLVPFGRYLLIEFPTHQVPHYAERLFYEMQLSGLTPIIVHPERNVELLKRPERLVSFIEKGALVQVTAASVMGRFGKKIQKFTHQLFLADAVHIIASDAHNTDSRGFCMGEAYGWIEKKYGEDVAEALQNNAKAVLANEVFYPNPPQAVKSGKRFGLF